MRPLGGRRLAGLQLLPGLDPISDESIAISLQSAVLGIDDGSGRPAEERARAAAAVLGLSYGQSLLSPAALRVGAAARADGAASRSVISLGPVAAAELAAASDPVAPPAPMQAPALPVSVLPGARLGNARRAADSMRSGASAGRRPGSQPWECPRAGSLGNGAGDAAGRRP
jgi:hypothetical protein